MPIEAGQQLLHYRLTEKIGEGGMGVVWKARDSDLERNVAIKLLPRAFTGDAERLARFRREAKLLASLSHPNIAAVFGLHSDGDQPFLAMELVDGEDLSQRMERGALPIEEALDVARQIAEALEVAHENGIVHRDLKPANVKLTSDGKVKVLDFGLAKAAASSPGGQQVDPSLSPTVTAAGTQTGMIMGTPRYMSPEQARGQAVDRRSDLWAFGCVLYEMLTGTSLFRGDTVSDTLAEVLRARFDLSTLPARTPRGVRRLLRRCLERDPARRLQAAGDARIELEEALVDPGHLEIVDQPTIHRTFSVSPTGLLAVAAIALLAAFAGWRLKPEPEPAPLRKLELRVPDLDLRSGFPLISPDGLRIAYAAGGRLWIRRLDRFEAVELPDSEGGETYFWSWDGQFLAYEKNRRLWKAPAEGGRSTVICDLPWNRGAIGGAWGAGDRILLSAWRGDLYEVNARGGEPKSFAKLDEENEVDYHWLAFLPDGESIVFDMHRVVAPDRLEVMSGDHRSVLLELPGRQDAFGERDPFEGGADLRTLAPAYASTGHLLYRRFDGGLWAVPFSAAELEVTGEPFLLAVDGRLPSVSRDGTLVYIAGAVQPWTELVWVDRTGAVIGRAGRAQRGLHYPRLSPDGTSVAYVAVEEGNQDLWVLDLAADETTRLTFSEETETGPAWIDGGSRVLFHMPKLPFPEIAVRDVGGVGSTRVLGEGRNVSVSLDGATMVYQRFDPATHGDLWSVSLAADASSPDLTAAQPILQSDAFENYPSVSPDGRYVAFAAEESGRREIFVHRLGDPDRRWQVSSEGSDQARWSPDGKTLFYATSEHVIAVPVSTGASFAMGAPRRLFSWKDAGLTLGAGFDTDGTRFLMVRTTERSDSGPAIRIVQNWHREFE